MRGPQRQGLGAAGESGRHGGLVRAGLRGCGGDLRPYPESNAKLLRGFKQESEEVMRFAFLKDHFHCSVESGLEGTRGSCCVRGDREGWTN